MDKQEINTCLKVYEKEVQIAVSNITRRLSASGRRVSLDDREDLEQEARVVLYKCLTRYRPEKGLLKTYIATALEYFARGKYRDYHRKQASFNYEVGSLNELIGEADDDLQSLVPDGKTEMIDDLERKIYCEGLLDKLSGRDKEWVTEWLSGKTLDEIGYAYGVSRQAVSQQIIKRFREIKAGED